MKVEKRTCHAGSCHRFEVIGLKLKADVSGSIKVSTFFSYAYVDKLS
jgi:hypothetical protein